MRQPWLQDFRRSCRPRCSAPPRPSNRINIGAIGTGRISRGHDLPGLWKHDSARIMAVCDLDSQRVAGRDRAGQRAIHQDHRQAVRRRHRLRALPRAARQQGRGRGGHQHAGSLARADRHRRGPRRQGRLSPEAGLADHQRRARAQQRRPPVRPDLPDRQPAAIVAAVHATPPSWCATAGSAS